MTTPDLYQAIALQLTTVSVGHLRHPHDVREQIHRNVARVAGAISASIRFLGAYNGTPVRLCVLPEYGLTGAPVPGSFADWRTKAAIPVEGDVYDALGLIARTHNIYLAGNAYEGVGIADCVRSGEEAAERIFNAQEVKRRF